MISVIATISKFVSSYFNKIGLNSTVICEVPVLGYFITEKKFKKNQTKEDFTLDNILQTFIPSRYFQKET